MGKHRQQRARQKRSCARPQIAPCRQPRQRRHAIPARILDGDQRGWYRLDQTAQDDHQHRTDPERPCPDHRKPCRRGDRQQREHATSPVALGQGAASRPEHDFGDIPQRQRRSRREARVFGNGCGAENRDTNHKEAVERHALDERPGIQA